MRRLPQSLLIILATGLIVRTLVVSFHHRPLISDEREYNQLAYNLSTQGSYMYGGTFTAYRPVGYPAFVAALYTLKYSPLLVKFVQVILDILTALLLYLLLEGFTSRARLAAAGLWAFFPPAILYTNFLMSETLFTFLLVLGIYLLTKPDGKGLRTTFFLGLVLGALLLIKPNVLLFLLATGLMANRLGLERQKVGMAVIGILLVTLPWIIRNSIKLETASLSTNGGINLLIGNNPNTTGAYAINFPPEAISGADNEVEVDRMATGYALRYILSHPEKFIMNAGRKLAHLVSSEGGLLVWSFYGDPESSAIRYGEKYSTIPAGLTLLVNLPYMLILLAGIPGFLSFPRGRLWWLVLFLLLTWIITHTVTFGGSRFHFPLMPFIAVCAAWFLFNVKELWNNLPYRLKIISAASIFFCIAVWLYEAYSVYHA